MEAMTLGDTYGINHLILRKHIGYFDLLFKETHDEIDFLLSSATIDLDFLDVRLFCSDLDFADLRVANCTDDLTILLSSSNLCRHWFIASLAFRLFPTFLIFCESFAFHPVPIPVESTPALVAQVASKNARQCSETTWRLNVTHKAHNNHRGGLQNGDRFHNLFFVEF